MHDRFRPVPPDLIPKSPKTGELITSRNVKGYASLVREIFRLGSKGRRTEVFDANKMVMQERLAEVAINSHLAEGLMNAVDWMLITLSVREHSVLRQRYALDTPLLPDMVDREAIGQGFHVSAERIRQLEQKALRKLRHPSREKEIKEVLQILE